MERDSEMLLVARLCFTQEPAAVNKLLERLGVSGAAEGFENLRANRRRLRGAASRGGAADTADTGFAYWSSSCPCWRRWSQSPRRRAC